jgi:hypothetical protein
MMGNKFRRLAIMGVLAILCMGPRQSSTAPEAQELARRASSRSRFPLAITDVSVSADTTDGRIVFLEVEITSTRDEADVRLWVELPDDVNVVYGDTFWQGSLAANTPHSHGLSLMVSTGGIWPVTLHTEAWSSRGFRYSDTETVRLRATSQGVTLVRESDFVVRQSVEAGHEPEFSLPDVRAGAPEAALEEGQILVRGTVIYGAEEYDGPGGTAPVANTLERAVLKLWDRESGRGRLLAETQAGPAGKYEFPPVSNRDRDGSGIDPYIEIYATDSTAPGRGRVRVVDDLDLVYRYKHHRPDDQADGVLDWAAIVPNTYEWRQAFYIFDKTANTAYNYLQDVVAWGNDDLVEINWPRNCLIPVENACFRPPALGLPGEIYLPENEGKRPDVIIHEYGHFVLSRYLGLAEVVTACFDVKRKLYFSHELFKKTSPRCAWSEGWADFFQMAVQNDGNYVGTDLEDVAGRGEAESYEFIIAASLWDFFDGANEAFDHFSDGFNGPSSNGVWHFSTADLPGQSRPPQTIGAFWEQGWLEGRPVDACYGSLILQHHRLPYRPFTYSLTTRAVPSGAGSVATGPGPNCPDGNYSEETRVTLTAEPNPGHSFRRWFGVSSNPLDNPATVFMNRNRRAYATFERALEISYYYSFGDLSGTVSVPPGETFTIWNETGGCGPVFRDIAECRTNTRGQVSAYNHDCLSEGGPGTVGPWVREGCSTAEEFGYVVQ